MPSQLIMEQDGTDAPSPPIDNVVLFPKDGNLYYRTSAGTIVPVNSTVHDLVIVTNQVTTQNLYATTTLNSWQTYGWNTKVIDDSNIASVSGNEITLQAGIYISSCHPIWYLTGTILYFRLWDSSNSVQLGRVWGFTSNSSYGSPQYTMIEKLVLTSTTTIRLQYWANAGNQNYSGNTFPTGTTEVATAVWKLERIGA